MQVDTGLGVLIPLVFCGFIIILAFLLMKRRDAADQLIHARSAFAAALASKGVDIIPSLIRTRGDTGAVVCEVHYGRAHYACGEYYPNDGQVFVSQYCNPRGDRGMAFTFPPPTP